MTRAGGGHPRITPASGSLAQQRRESASPGRSLVAQSAARRPVKAMVEGSSPSGGAVGLVAQWKRASFARKRSRVRLPPGPRCYLLGRLVRPSFQESVRPDEERRWKRRSAVTPCCRCESCALRSWRSQPRAGAGRRFENGLGFCPCGFDPRLLRRTTLRSVMARWSSW
jgi:hypothetical protein